MYQLGPRRSAPPVRDAIADRTQSNKCGSCASQQPSSGPHSHNCGVSSSAATSRTASVSLWYRKHYIPILTFFPLQPVQCAPDSGCVSAVLLLVRSLIPSWGGISFPFIPNTWSQQPNKYHSPKRRRVHSKIKANSWKHWAQANKNLGCSTLEAS